MKGLIASDIDGTLMLEDSPTLPQAVIHQITRLTKDGWLFAAASGRQYHSLRRLFAPVDGLVAYICENGAAVYSPEGTVLNKTAMPRGETEALCRDLWAIPQCEVLISGVNMSYVNPKTEDIITLLREVKGNLLTLVPGAEAVPEEIIKVAAYLPQGSSQFPKALMDKWSHFHPAVSGACWVDFNLSHKGTGVQALCAAYGLSLSGAYAFGDNFNDEPMLSLVGHPYIMSTASPALLARFPNHCTSVPEVLAQL